MSFGGCWWYGARWLLCLRCVAPAVFMSRWWFVGSWFPLFFSGFGVGRVPWLRLLPGGRVTLMLGRLGAALGRGAVFLVVAGCRQGCGWCLVCLLACATCMPRCGLLGVLGVVVAALWFGGPVRLDAGVSRHALLPRWVSPGCALCVGLLWYMWGWCCVSCRWFVG